MTDLKVRNNKIIAVVILVLVQAFGIYTLVSLWQSYNLLIDCESKESSTCPKFTCPGTEDNPTSTRPGED